MKNTIIWTIILCMAVLLTLSLDYRFNHHHRTWDCGEGWVELEKGVCWKREKYEKLKETVEEIRKALE